jgi:hypothetical protein
LSVNWRRWGPILFGAAVLAVFLVVGAGLVGVVWVRDHLTIEPMAASTAEDTFEALRREHAGKPALVTMRDAHVERHDPPRDAPRVRLNTLHVVAWDPDERRLARFDLPFWFLRLKDTPIQFGTYASGLDDMGFSLRASDIERHGRGIIVDVETRHGERAILWAE